MPSSPLPLVSRLTVACRSRGHRPLVAAALFVALIHPKPGDATTIGIGEFDVWPPSGRIITTPHFFVKADSDGLDNAGRAEGLSDGDLILEATDTDGEPHVVPLLIIQKLKPGYPGNIIPGTVLQMRASAPLLPGRSYALRENPERPGDQREFNKFVRLPKYQVISASSAEEPLSKKPVSLRFIRERLYLGEQRDWRWLDIEFEAPDANRLLFLAKDSSGQSILSFAEKKPPPTPSSISLRNITGSCLFTDPNWAPLKAVEIISFLPHGEIGEKREIEFRTNPLTTSVIASLARLQPKHPCAKMKVDETKDSE